MSTAFRWLQQRWIEVLLWVGSLCVYALTAYPGPGGRLNYGDSVKFQLMPVVDGVPHATGYPLYLLLTEWLDVLVPWGTPAARVTLLSCACGAWTVVGAYRLGRGLDAARLPSALAALLLAGSYTFWVICSEAEVYALHLALTAWVLVFLLRFQRDRSTASLVAGAAVYAASLGHHLMTLTLLPAIAFAIVTTRPQLLRRARFWLGVAGTAFAGLLQYGYILYRSHLPEAGYLEYVGRDASVGRVLHHMTGAQFADRFFALGVGEVLSVRLPLVGRELARELTVVGLLLAAAGLWSVRRWPAARRGVALVGIAALGQLALSLSYSMEMGPLLVPLPVLAGGLIALGASRGRLARLSVAALGAAALASTAANLMHRDVLADNPRHRRAMAEAERARGCSVLLLGAPTYADGLLIRYLQETGAFPQMELTTRLEPLLEASGRACVAPSQRHTAERSGLLQLTPRHRQTFEGYLAARRRLVVVLSVKDEASAKLSDAVEAYLRQRGSTVDALSYRGSYAAVLVDDRVVAEALSNDEQVTRAFEAGDRLGSLELPTSLRVTSAGLAAGNRSSIQVGGLECSPNRRGFNVAVFDRELRFVESVVVDTYLTSELVDVYLAERATDPP